VWDRAGATADGAVTLATCGQRRPRAGPPVVVAPQHAQNKAKVSLQPSVKHFTVLRSRDFIPYPYFSIPDPGSNVKKEPDPGSGSTTKDLSNFNSDNCYLTFENMIQDAYCGSRIWNFFYQGSRIQFFHPGSSVKKAPDPESRCAFFTQIIVIKLVEKLSRMFIADPGSRIWISIPDPDPGVKKVLDPDPQH
jgi:hypothetical protein